MKILILSIKMPWPPKDGGAIATLNLGMGLARSGADVTLLTMNTRKHYFPAEKIPNYIKDLIHIRSVDVNTNINPFRLILNYLFSSYPYIAERFISKAFQQELEQCLREEDFDIIQMEGPYLEHYTEYIKGKALLSLRAHNLENRIWALRAKEDKNPLKRLYFQSLSRRIYSLEKKLLKEIDLLLPISDSDAEGFRDMGHTLPTKVCPTGMDMEKYPVNTETGEIRLFYIGALDWGPNQEGLDWFFNHVWPDIMTRFPDMVLHIAGRNPSHYFTSAPPHNVETEGEVEDAISFYRDHNVMIVPLLSGSGIRIKILEAMAMGKVVIGSSIASAGLGVEDGVHLFVANNADEYLKILQKISKDPRIIEEIGHQARQFVTENFDNLVLSNKLISFYKEQLA